ncbi:MAG TPA: O-methyltransferase [Ignavibacteria bacterium]|nr:O-methyltransferase [Bacteroidota bacterium]HRE12001.1 O-methyltransferase [Ignavibacteria bacterium]HRF65433.1 O-methyltransferase [Ignavibacteria bacterium]HRJ04566.1 O-methyltransferase [Ignavibacteria bacterium]HRJ86471.1 O-methyltransferase [Ignavibacteria bacterium]
MKGVPLTEELYKYITDTFIHEDELLKQIVIDTEAKNIPLIQVSPETGKLLGMFIKMIGAKHVLEIGTLTGYSTIWMARALPDEGSVTTLELTRAHADEALNNYKKAGLDGKIELILGKALDSLDTLSGRSFDLVFIDADKENCVNYFNKVINMVRPGGLIITDNTLRRGEVIDPNPGPGAQGIIAYNKLAANDSRVESLLVPIDDGITLSFVK